jgi:hypothetical protein
MSYKAVVAVAGGDETTMAKSIVIIAQDIAQSWYNNFQPRSIDSWGTSVTNCAQTSNASTPQPTIPWIYSLAKKPKESHFRSTDRTPNITDKGVILVVSILYFVIPSSSSG